ncbi:cytochrome P450 [Mycena galopus ATCC 62051]|nr:cytochrome P450 [Mycena galopus ATCC 62051]
MSSTESVLVTTIVAAYLLAVFVYRHRRVQSAIKNVAGPPAASFWTGNYPLLHDAEKGWGFFEAMYSYGGLCRIATPLGNDHSFDDPTEVYITLQMVLGNKGLGSTIGPLHKKQRRLLNPVFGSAHLRNMTPIIFNVTQTLRETYMELCADGPIEIDMVQWSSRTALEIIGQSALGHSFDPLTKDSYPSGLGAVLKSGFASLSTPASRLSMKYVLPLLATPRLNNLLLKISPAESAKMVDNFCTVMKATSQEIYTEKKRLFDQDPEQLDRGKDAMSILIRENLRSTGEDRMDEEEIISHITSVSIIFGGTDTTSSALLRALWLLAEHPKDQEQLRTEIQRAKADIKGQISYDQLLALPFLDAVYREAIRLFPPVPYQDRLCVKDTLLPLGTPVVGVNGKQMKEIFVPRGTVIAVSLVGTNRNPDIWGEDAREWNPERWLGNLPNSVKESGVPGAYSSLMSFLDGRRACLGVRYVQAEMSASLFRPIENSHIQIPYRGPAVRTGRFLHFSPSAQHNEITWPMGIVVSPSVGGKMSMPLKISRA